MPALFAGPLPDPGLKGLDLYYLLATVHLRVTPLRERRDEIPILAEGHLARLDPDRAWRLSLEARRLLVAPNLAWSGNVRQLEALLRRARDRALAESEGADELRPEHFDAADFGLAALPVAAAAPRAAPPTTGGDRASRRAGWASVTG